MLCETRPALRDIFGRLLKLSKLVGQTGMPVRVFFLRFLLEPAKVSQM